jgi:predicted O-methyltransferase YrrM
MEPTPEDVDVYLRDTVVREDEEMADIRTATAAAGLPQIEVSAGQGKLLGMLVRLAGARRILEIGTLGGYSTTWMARSLPSGGWITTCEFDEHHAEVAQMNLEAAGVAELVQIRLGPALETLPELLREKAGPFDLVFIDADKENNPHYVEWAIRLSRPGALIVLDNVVRGGSVLEPGAPDTEEGRAVNGTRGALELLGEDPRVDATAIQTTGAKGWDGFAVAVVL